MFKKWPENNAIYCEETDKYYFNKDDFIEELTYDLRSQGGTIPWGLCTFFECDLVYATSAVLDIGHFNDSFNNGFSPQDDEWPSELHDAMDKFNEAMEAYTKPVCFAATERRIILKQIH